eukprot:GHVT01067609.1.p1 GENE.GHVT01067609.1~~GHVT01067609.1.p1  ORF type:complete len:108 (+),score=11.27 GHVT01067609.1:234-557(+)
MFQQRPQPEGGPRAGASAGPRWCSSKRGCMDLSIQMEEWPRGACGCLRLQDFVVGSKPTMTAGGTEAYLAPEVWNRTSHMYSPYKLDVWALGTLAIHAKHSHANSHV